MSEQKLSKLKLWLHRRGIHAWKFVDRWEQENPLAYHYCTICGKTETANAYNALT